MEEGLTVSSTFERSEPEYVQSKRAKRERRTAEVSRAEAAEGGSSGGGGGGGGASAAAGLAPVGTADEAADECMADAEPAVTLATRAPPPDSAAAPVVAAAEAQAAAAAAAAEDVAVPPQPEAMSYASYYKERWGQRSLQPQQPLLLAARVSRQQLARGLDMRRGRKRSFALHLEAEGGFGGAALLPADSFCCNLQQQLAIEPALTISLHNAQHPHADVSHNVAPLPALPAQFR